MSGDRLTGAHILRFLDDPDRPVRVIVWSREETESCEAGTPGCCIDHGRETEAGYSQGSCVPW